jgi:hypothetical protein
MQLCELAQYFIVAGQVHVPAMHGMPGWQTLPHDPQLLVSLVTSMQPLPQNFWPGGQRFSQVQVVVFSVSPEAH